MAKNNKKPKEAESVVKYDQLGEVVANSCLGKRPVGPSGDLQNINIESLIHIIRGQKVMFDSDLAMLYGVETRTLNQAVKRNITRFPDDFMFQVTKEEWNSLRSQIVTLEDLKSQNVISNSVDEEENERLTSQNVILKNGRGQHRKFMPYVFTRNGIGMLSSVLRSETAVDNFVDDRVLSLLDKRTDGVEATIHSRYYEPFLVDLKKHNAQYREIEFVQLSQKNHDRFLIVDDDVFLLGASVKDMGAGMCAVTKMQVSPELILGLLK